MPSGRHGRTTIPNMAEMPKNVRNAARPLTPGGRFICAVR